MQFLNYLLLTADFFRKQTYIPSSTSMDLNAMYYTLNVEIAAHDLVDIRQGNYSLCLTKDIKFRGEEARGNVVFIDALPEHMAPKLQFGWEERYQTFLSYRFQTRKPVESATNSYDISCGMTADFDQNGNAQVSGHEDNTKPIVVRNNWKSGGRVALASYDPTLRKFATSFVSDPTLPGSSNNLAPIDKVGVFFHSSYVAGTIIDTSETPVFPINFANKTSMTVRYEDGKWRTVV